MHKIFNEILNNINKSKNILLTIHKNPDGDALGSLIGFIDFLENNNKKYNIFLPEKISNDFYFLAHLDLIENKNINNINNINFNTIIILDSADYADTYLKDSFEYLKKNSNIINIDHHISNPHFGHINCVNPKASSTAEIVFDFFKYVDYKINNNIATALLCGIVCDTEIFYNAATNTNSAKQASELLKLGADLNIITKKIFHNKKISYIKFLGALLSKIEFHSKLGILTLIIRQDDLMNFNISEQEIHGIANMLKNTREAKAVLILRETKDGKIKGSLRGREIDVAKLAQALGGGGHSKAAGFIIDGKLRQDENGIWQII